MMRTMAVFTVFLAERLLDVWMETNHIAYTELPVVFLENQHWLKKGHRISQP